MSLAQHLLQSQVLVISLIWLVTNPLSSFLDILEKAVPATPVTGLVDFFQERVMGDAFFSFGSIQTAHPSLKNKGSRSTRIIHSRSAACWLQQSLWVCYWWQSCSSDSFTSVHFIVHMHVHELLSLHKCCRRL
jgi:hypothetical protein